MEKLKGDSEENKRAFEEKLRQQEKERIKKEQKEKKEGKKKKKKIYILSVEEGKNSNTRR
jgi:hypothetical protein